MQDKISSRRRFLGNTALNPSNSDVVRVRGKRSKLRNDRKLTADASDLPLAKVVAVVNRLPVLTIPEYVNVNFKGQATKVSGTVRSLSDDNKRYATVVFDSDEDDIRIAARFSKPLTAGVRLLSKGENVEVLGNIRSISSELVSLDNCRLSEIDQNKETAAANARTCKEKSWSETWWGSSVILIVTGLVVWLISWQIGRYYDRPRSTAPSASVQSATTIAHRQQSRFQQPEPSENLVRGLSLSLVGWPLLRGEPSRA
jgi:hypothetical protein